jgi:uncharacterized protein (TIGR02453 family)
MALDKSYVSFFNALAANNTTAWFNANKKQYEQSVKAPFLELIGEVIALMKKQDPRITMEPKDAVFRINRDTRFSNDKNPYKVFMEAIVSRAGRKDHSVPGIYFRVDANSVTVAGGAYSPEKEDLLKIRKAIVKDPKGATKVFEQKKFVDITGGLAGDKYKIIPPEFKATAEVAPAIYNKSFHFEKTYKGVSNVTRSDLAKFIVDHYKAAEGLNGFITNALGK